MTYTSDELESVIAYITLQLPSNGTTHLALELASQLLDTMRENARLQARIEAAAAIAARDMADASDVEDIIAAGGANEMRAEFRKALGL